jgi:recombination protein RecT
MSTTTQPTNPNAPVVQPGAAVVQKKPAGGDLRQLIEGPEFKEAIAKALPRHLTPDRFIRVAITSMLRVPKLAQCSQATFVQALLQLSQYGLEPDGRRAHLIPFKNNKASEKAGRDVYDVQLVIDYKGLAELVLRSGVVSYLHADVIREGDLFEYSRGELKQHVNHFLRTDAAKPEKAGKVIGAYAVAKMKDGTEKAEVMSIDQLEGIRKRSKAANDGPWKTDPEEMQKKTVFRRLSKWLPLSSEVRDAAENDDDVIDLDAPVAARGTASIAGGLSAALMPPADEEDEAGLGETVITAEQAPAVDREKLIAGMKEAVLDSKGALTEKKLFEFAKRSALVPEGIDDVWALPTAALVKVNEALAELAKGGR